jgi:hypothetical protein
VSARRARAELSGCGCLLPTGQRTDPFAWRRSPPIFRACIYATENVAGSPQLSSGSSSNSPTSTRYILEYPIRSEMYNAALPSGVDPWHARCTAVRGLIVERAAMRYDKRRGTKRTQTTYDKEVCMQSPAISCPELDFRRTDPQPTRLSSNDCAGL